ncbi:DNA-binding transcriptional regulator, MurR/RpiR family, contains HTH and SIS domains [Lentibacillus persicus]|uniref:DNA-binding transcriptional regulator, MurR/RpiR family, contains HTH and SIS domains n=1 Tax=Lentibacillus persicus TaxID=640948 RepID=A0A1I1XWF2_9BACI|nr:MurR/RpiR family transcriptional regulator [Lentibacillus persicus]SFE11695.1 DNA-binding transcriptional regulator, MurR/RpiR family, contains HTH and SIS domains [Lentibacillus persicus]
MELNQLNGVKPSITMEQYKHSFTKSEKKIYQYIQSNSQQVLYHSLTELSEESGVAEATVLRFFRKLGFKGFQDFKFLYAQEMAVYDERHNEATYADKIKDNMVQAIENSHEVIDYDILQQCIETINAADDVVLFGVGSSGIAALDMQNRLMRIGKHVSAVTDPHFQFMRASSMNAETVVIALSLTGSTKDIVDSVEIAKQQNATVIALTNYIKSPLTQYADHVLLSSAKESPLDSGSLVAKVSQLFLIDLICTGLTIKNYNHAEQIKMGISKNTARKLY